MKKYTLRVLALLLTLSMTVGLLASCSSSASTSSPSGSAAASSDVSSTAPAKAMNLVLCSSAEGGASYYLATGLCKILNEYCPQYNITNEATSGSGPENGQFVTDSPLDTFGMLNNDTLNSALKGLTDRGFRQALPDLRIAMVGHMQYLYGVVLQNSDIKTFADLKGKKIALPPAGQGAYYQFFRIMEAYGLSEDDYSAVAMTNAEAGDALKDGTVQAAFVSGSIPQTTVSDLDLTKDIDILTLDQEHADAIIKENPQYGTATIPAGSYKDVAHDVLTLTLNILIVCDANMDAQIVYDFIKTIDEHSDEMKEVHANGGEYCADSSKSLYESGALPFHDGSVKYFKELWG